MLDRSQELERIALIEALNVLDPALGRALDPITELAAFTFDVPIALISIVDSEAQHSISRVGLDSLVRVERQWSICACAIESHAVLQVEDLSLDSRFAANPAVTGPDHLRFYAGAPLVTRSGIALGALCLIDRKPRVLGEDETRQLQTLARLVVNQMELRMSVGRRDAVSGLPNRQQFQSDLGVLGRQDGGHQYTGVLLDVFDLQSTTDAGQVLGLKPVESLLRQASLRVQDMIGEFAQVYHVAATRFGFVLRDHSHEQVEALLDRLRERMRRPLMVGSIPMSPQFHAGVCTFRPEPDQTADLLRKCLVAMHHALQTDACVCWYSKDRDEYLRRRYRLASDAGRGLSQDQFTLVYQPRFDLVSGLPVSAEALLRWTHPSLGPVSPAEFIPVLECTALMPTLSRWVVEQAVQQAARWQSLLPGFAVSLNLSPRDFDDEQLWQRMAERLQMYGLPASLIEVEITEGQWLHSHPAALPQLRAMAAAGVRVAIDDFGSGYSNFGYLAEVPISHIKIDRSLITGLADSRTARLKVDAIIRLAEQLGYRTVAEGVEHEAELELLRAWGCDEAQGFHLARPMRAEAVTQLVLACRAGPLADA